MIIWNVLILKVGKWRDRMEKLNILGTGHAMTLDCYNTCFTLENNEVEDILVDTRWRTTNNKTKI